MIGRFLMLCFALIFSFKAYPQFYEVKTGKVMFRSEARQELIKANSGDLIGVLDAVNKTFVFKIKIASFYGFNSPLQRDHFNENYMETTLYPYAYFSGKIIEDIDFTREGQYTVRAKGKLKIHGVEQERIIYTRLSISGNTITANADFVVSLADYNIKIPRVVYNKLATDIDITTTATLVKK